MDAVEELRAIEEIKRLKGKYFRCIDTKDWDGFGEVFTPDATIDMTEVFSPQDYKGDRLNVDGSAPEPLDAGFRVSGVKAIVDQVRAALAPCSTVHHGHTPEIVITSPTTATGTWAMEDKTWWAKGSPIQDMHAYGHYRETYERLPQGWRIKTSKLTRIRVDLRRAISS